MGEEARGWERMGEECEEGEVLTIMSLPAFVSPFWLMTMEYVPGGRAWAADSAVSQM